LGLHRGGLRAHKLSLLQGDTGEGARADG
jgi:hypothetical protein